MDFLSALVGQIVNIAFIFGPTSAYFFQYRLVRRTRSLGTFSIDVCAILIFANILRILFWFCKGFEISLLYQSIVMITVQLFLLKECIKVKTVKFTEPGQTPISSITAEFDKLNTWEKLKYENFWRYNDYASYVEITFVCLGLLSLLTVLFYKNEFYGQLIGSLSVIIEACLGLPQLMSNNRNKTTAGLSIGLILVWFAGDLGKTIFFLIKDTPIQFVLCGISQIIIDVLILMQIYTYGGTEYKEVETESFKEQHVQV